MKNLLIEKGYVFITLTYLSKPLSHLQVLTHAQAGKASFIFNMNFFENQKKKKRLSRASILHFIVVKTQKTINGFKSQ